MAVECAKHQLLLFEPKAVQYSILKTEQVMLKPLASIEGSTVIQFSDQGYGEDYKNLESVYIVLKVKMIHKKTDDGTEIKTEIKAGDIVVAPVNNFLHSLFRQITLTLNGRVVGQNQQNYAYRAYIDNILNYSLEASNQHLDGTVFKLDTAGKFDKIAGNSGLISRALLFQPGEEVELIGRLHLDMLNSPKFLLNNIDIGLSFELNKPEFFLQKASATNTSSLKILDATLFIDHVKVNPDLAFAQQKILDSGKNAVYSYKRCEVRNYLVSSEATSFSWDNVCNGTLPEFVIIAFTSTSGYQGDVLQNPFNFQHFDLETISVSINGIEVAPRNLTFDFNQKNPRSQHGYFSLFKQLNLHKFDQPNLIDRNLYNNGCFLLAYDLTPDRDTDCANFINSGALRIEAKFSKALPASITVLAYLQFDADLVIDKDKNVFPSLG